MNSQSKTYDKSYDYEEDKYPSVDDSVHSTINLDCGNELRIELDSHNGITVSLIEGFAEVFGAELPPETPVYYPPRSVFAIFTWHKATLLIRGNMETHYISRESPMEQYLETHASINEDRDIAKEKRVPGPNVIVCGSASSGKSTLCKILINYALKMAYKPILIDLDIVKNEVVPPGCIGATKIKLPLPNDDLADGTVCMFYGYSTKNMIKPLYQSQVKKLSEIINQRVTNKAAELNKEYADLTQSKQNFESIKSTIDPFTTSDVPTELASGCIINAMLHSQENSHETVKNLAEQFKADYIIVIDYEKLFIKLRHTYQSNLHMKIIRLPASSGVVDTDQVDSDMLKNMKYRSYFSGPTSNLDVYEQDLPLADYKIFKVDILTIPKSALPTGALEDQTKIVVKKVTPRDTPMQNKIMAAIEPSDGEKLDKIDQEIEIGEKNSKEELYSIVIEALCRGLVHVNYWDEEKDSLIVSGTCQEGIRSKHLLIADMTYEKE